MKRIKIYTIFNAGLLVDAGDIRVMVDGINTSTQYFDGITDEVFGQMMGEEGIFQRCDFLLYSHHHKDHFSAQRNVAYVQSKRPQAVVLPYLNAEFHHSVVQAAIQSGTSIYTPSFPAEREGEIRFDGCTLRYYGINHSGKEYAQVPHCCFVLDIGGFTIWIGADGNYMDFDQHKRLFNQHIDLAFVNPLYLNHATGRRIICAVGADETFIYHMPQHDRVDLPMRRQAGLDLNKYQTLIPQNITILYDSMTEIYPTYTAHAVEQEE